MSTLPDEPTPDIRIRWDEGRISEWYAALAAVPRSTLTQSFGYAHAMMTVERWKPRLGLVERGGATVGMVMVLQKRLLRLVRVTRIHRAPLLVPESDDLRTRAAVYRLLRIEYPSGPTRWTSIIPELTAGPESETLLRWAGWRRQPGPGYRTIWLDLEPDETSLRKTLDQKWRNALSKAERSGLTVELDRGGETLPWLLDRYNTDRAERQYRGASAKLLTRLRTALHKDGDVLVMRALDGGEPVAGMLFLGHGRAATYQVGWSGPRGRETNAHHLLLWRAMLELKSRGRTRLDLGGLTPKAEGVNRFKRGLGGEEVELAGVWS
jgi:hypothetical protein